MKKTLWCLIGILLLGSTQLHAQKKKTIVTNVPTLAPIEDPEFTFSQGVGVALSSVGEKKKDVVLTNAKQLTNLGGRMLKIDLPPPEKISSLIGLPLTHLFLEVKLNANEAESVNEEAFTEFYNRMYSLAKDLLTRRETPGKSFFIGIKVSTEKNDEQKIKWINKLATAIDDARAEVRYTRCKIYSYAILNAENDDARYSNLLPKIKTHYIALAFDFLKKESLTESRIKLNKINVLLPSKPELAGNRVIISDLNTGINQTEGVERLIKKFLEAGVIYMFLENPNGLNAETITNTTCNKLKEIYTKQNEAARDMKVRTGRFPLNEEIINYTATLF